ncbi:MAG: tetratricopeptide repeat protein [Anaerolineae bacterium]|nr:tetratricopeptide repeat protein [Anaerolineae bacterium]
MLNQPPIRSIRLSIPDRYYERALDYFSKNKLDLAILDMDEAIKLVPRRAEYYVARGLMRLQSGLLDEAEADFAQGLSLDPRQWLAHYGRGMRAFQANQFREAVVQFSRAQQVAPQRPEIYYYRAAALHWMGSPPEAIRDMEYALSLLEEDDVRVKQGKRWMAIFQKAIPAQPR